MTEIQITEYVTKVKSIADLKRLLYAINKKSADKNSITIALFGKIFPEENWNHITKTIVFPIMVPMRKISWNANGR